jgi:hypothetical protein
MVGKLPIIFGADELIGVYSLVGLPFTISSLENKQSKNTALTFSLVNFDIK